MSLKFWKKKGTILSNKAEQPVQRQDARQAKAVVESQASVFAQRGDELIRKKDYETAIVMFSEALECSPNNYELHFKRALVGTLLSQPRYDLALLDLECVERLHSGYTPVLELKAGILKSLGISIGAEDSLIEDSTSLPHAYNLGYAQKISQSSGAEEAVPPKIHERLPDQSQESPKTKIPECPEFFVTSLPGLPTPAPTSHVDPATRDPTPVRSPPSLAPSLAPMVPPVATYATTADICVGRRGPFSPSDTLTEGKPTSGDRTLSNGAQGVDQLAKPASTAREAKNAAQRRSAVHASTVSRNTTLTEECLSSTQSEPDPPTKSTLAPEPRPDPVLTIPAEIRHKLEARGIRVTSTFLDDQNPLTFAARRGHTDILKYIFAHRDSIHPFINVQDTTTNPLAIALKEGHRKAAKVLLHHGAKLPYSFYGIYDLVELAGVDIELLDLMVRVRVGKDASIEYACNTKKGLWFLVESFRQRKADFVHYLWEHGTFEYVRTHEAEDGPGWDPLETLHLLCFTDGEYSAGLKDIQTYFHTTGGVHDIVEMWQRSQKKKEGKPFTYIPRPPASISGTPPTTLSFQPGSEIGSNIPLGKKRTEEISETSRATIDPNGNRGYGSNATSLRRR